MNHFIDELIEKLGVNSLIVDVEQKKFYETDHRGLHFDEAVCVILPRNTEEVSSAVIICQKHKVKIVPQAGNTGLTGGSTPLTLDKHGNAIGPQAVISVARLNQIEEIDTVGNSMTVGAGCILQNIHQAAEEQNRFFPLKLGAWGSCQIGGNISTNAGGVNVLAYGNTRALVLGLEVVLADGSIWSGLSKLHKDNTGFDLKQLFIGGEGLIGIVTKAVIKLFPLPTNKATVFSAINCPSDGLNILNRLKILPQGLLTSIELIPRVFIEHGEKVVEGLKNPFDKTHPWYLLTEHSLFIPDSDDKANRATHDAILQSYGELLEQGLIQDAAIAQSEQQTHDFWLIREGTTPTQASLGASIKHDVSVPVHLVPELITLGMTELGKVVPNCRPLPFGHLGDGNLHFNVCQPEDMSANDFRAKTDEVNKCLHDVVIGLGGSISAEHGIGRLRREELARVKTPVELQLLKQVKTALDPNCVFNPGKVL
ncbi:MAG: FAD-binding oxidoreductase [Alphaproteobacteria bacterium]